jgi:2-polyprenyl-6-methoxyphenol hydroxylase-like FAD-dependent oxidoreductase
MTPKSPIVIVGAGIVGLTLGQCLKRKSIPFEIYERDLDPDVRGQGWAITIHWALPYLEKMLPKHVLSRIEAAQVDPDVARNDHGNFLFLNLATGEPKFKIPPNRRWRVNRERMRRALMEGIEGRIHWGQRVVGIEVDAAEDEVQVLFNDGSKVQGSMCVGIEGSQSVVRQFLRPDAFANQQLPIRFSGVAINMSPTEIAPLRAVDPLLFQGCHPQTQSYLWISVLETPQSNGTGGTDHEQYRAQFCVSWPYRDSRDEVGATDKERLINMKKKADGFVPFLRRAIDMIPDGTPVTEVKLADWECLDWNNSNGLVTLAGDAAHAMTMCESRMTECLITVD